MLLDVRLPGMDGFEVLRRLDAAGARVPVMLVTSLEDEVDQLVGYRLGAVDYVVKPVSPKVLAAKVKAFTSRIVEGEAPPNRTVCGPIVIEHDAHRVLVDGAEVVLTRLEYGLLAALAEHPAGSTRATTAARGLGDRRGDDRDAPRRPARHEPAPQARRRRRATGLVHTVRGLGYRLSAPAAEHLLDTTLTFGDRDSTFVS